MTAKELIKLLQQVEGDAVILVHYPDENLHPLEDAVVVEGEGSCKTFIRLDTEESWLTTAEVDAQLQAEFADAFHFHTLH